MRNITFEKISSTFTILNPFNGFAPEEHRVEVRKDPLLGDTSVHNPYLKDKARAFFGENDAELIKKLAEESSKGCIFCGENVLQDCPISVRAPFQGTVTDRGGCSVCEPFFRGSISPGHCARQQALPETFGIHPPTACGRHGGCAGISPLRVSYGCTRRFAAVCANYLLPARSKPGASSPPDAGRPRWPIPIMPGAGCLPPVP